MRLYSNYTFQRKYLFYSDLPFLMPFPFFSIPYPVIKMFSRILPSSKALDSYFTATVKFCNSRADHDLPKHP